MENRFKSTMVFHFSVGHKLSRDNGFRGGAMKDSAMRKSSETFNENGDSIAKSISKCEGLSHSDAADDSLRFERIKCPENEFHIAGDPEKSAVESWAKALRETEEASPPSANARDEAEAFLKRGNSHSFSGEYDQAISDYTEAIRFDPDNALAYRNRSLAYRRKKNESKAERDLNTYLRIIYSEMKNRAEKDETGDFLSFVSDALNGSEIPIATF
jgi:tetratricopeptide (TPR) repeat protein